LPTGLAINMTKFQVTLNFSCERNYSDDESEYESNRTSKRKQEEAFERTDKYYEEYDLVSYIKENSAMEMVGYILDEGEVLSAEWDSQEFAIHMVVETDQTAEEICQGLESNSLEDGEYEACGETGWILFTRGENGEVFDGRNMDDVWEYALVDYRQNPIVVKEVVA
jgi:hypothetical protein